jgi:(R)-2-hydroxyacyl-CoA dehydratese activating ATPase
VEKSVRLMKRVQMEPEFTLAGGIMRFPTMVDLMRRHLSDSVNVPPEPMAQYSGAIGAAVLARRRLARLQAEGAAA